MVTRSIKTSKVVIFLALLINFFSCKNNKNPLISNMYYKQEMKSFIKDISSYAKKRNPHFFIIPQNGVELVSITGESGDSPDMDYISSIDGIGQESLNYGYNGDDQATPSDETERLKLFLDMAKSNGDIKIMVTDYCFTESKVDSSYHINNMYDYISFAADHRELDNIPTYPTPTYNESPDTITDLSQAKNYLYLINPDNGYSNKEEFIESVKSTNYDYVIMDLFFNGEEFTPDEIEELRDKENGGKRLLICYMSIGEAENYRYYWQSDWEIGTPTFIDSENPNWEGNYIVKYWESDWQDIIYGNDDSYLKKIINAGFDGVYLDAVDSFEQFD
ncbi:MAG: hypothetical protein CR982_07440 [Candidatus Cloacimonadota bacterium]|nr:MAG: hypothetical protein CR982_07440 [Candidatus Cloacimonadota bacterium]PIE80165.1 MAG: hypothetical protein CSA15_02085 [Candidatus Delongbacteria bacterium]